MTGRASPLAALRSRLPGAEPARTLLWVSLLDSTGTGLYLAGATVFFIRMVGLSPVQVGIGLAIAATAGFLTTVPIGLAADRYGSKHTLVALQLWLACTFTGLAFVHGMVAFVLVGSLLAMADRSSPPMIQAVVADLTGGAKQVTTMATLRSVRNVGYSAGALIAASLLSVPGVWTFRCVLLGNAASFVVAAVLLSRVRVVPRGGAVRTARLGALRRLLDRHFLAVTGLNGILVLHMTLLSVALPLWVIEHTKAPVTLVPVLFAVNTVLAVALQMRFARGDGDARRGVRTFRRAAAALVLCCLVLAVAGSTGLWPTVVLLVVATVLLTAGELWQSVTGWEVPVRYAPDGRRGEYLAVFSLGVTAQSILGPVLVTALIVLGTAGWVIMAGLFVVAAALIGPAIAALERDRAPAAPSTTLRSAA